MALFNFNQNSAAALEVVINRILKLDPEAQSQLSQFSNKVIHFHITDLDLNYYLLFPNASVVVKTEHNGKTAASISGKLSAFLAATSNEHSGDAVFSGELSFTGEVQTISKLQHFAQSLHLDWQEPISAVFGDYATHNLTKTARHLGGFIKQFVEQTLLDIPEYLQHEAKVTPTAYEIKDFAEQVDLVRSHTDRLTAKIKRLELALQQQKTKANNQESNQLQANSLETSSLEKNSLETNNADPDHD